jgi:hypothetical protein
VFRRFDELGSARQVLMRLREDGVLFAAAAQRFATHHLGSGDLPGGA